MSRATVEAMQPLLGSHVMHHVRIQSRTQGLWQSNTSHPDQPPCGPHLAIDVIIVTEQEGGRIRVFALAIERADGVALEALPT